MKRFWHFYFTSLLILFSFASSLFAQWGPDVRLTTNDSVSVTSYNNTYCVAAGPTGYVHVVWYDNRDRNSEIYYKRSPDGGTNWSLDTRLTSDPADSYDPSISVLGSSVHVVWWDYRDGNWEIYYNRSTNSGTTWTQDTRLTYNDSISTYPAVSSSDSLVHVVWYDTRDGNSEVYYKRSSNRGVNWGPDVRLTSTQDYSWFPAVWSSGAVVHVVWMDNRDGNGEIYYKRSTDSGTNWSQDLRLTNNGASSQHPSISGIGSYVYVVWYDDRDGNDEIYYKLSPDTGTSWSPDTRLTNSLGASLFPSVLSAGPNVHVVWEDTRDGNDEIYYKRSTNNGTTWSTDTALTNDTARSWYPSLAISDTIVHVVWSDRRDRNYEIYYKRNPRGNPPSGIVEDKGREWYRGPEVKLQVTPNPFVSFATIPGHEAERFALYDISGRKVGTFKGDRVGEGLSAGVYFLRAEKGDRKPLRIVKVR